MTLPYPELPYPAAPGWCFPVFELSFFALFLWCLFDARRRGAGALAYLFGGFAFGLLLENFEVLGGSYTYGHFWLSMGHAPTEVPICVGCGWAIIMYSARLFSDAVGLPLWAAASLDTLLALNIDMSMDVVAYRLHMWHWDWTPNHQNALTSQWFGIPYGNFVGWITVVFCYSAFSRLLERFLLRRRESALRHWAVALGAILGSIAVLVFTEEALFPVLNQPLGFRSGPRLILLTVLLIFATVRGWSGKDAVGKPMPAIGLWVPGWVHVFFVSCFFLLGIYRENVWMTSAAAASIALGLAFHFYPRFASLQGTGGVVAAPAAMPFAAPEAEKP